MENTELYGYDLYKSMDHKKEPTFETVENIRNIFQTKYSNITDKNLAFELLHKAKKQKEFKKLSYNIITGLFASLLSIVLTSICFENISYTENFTSMNLIVALIIAPILIFFIIYVCHKTIEKKFNNTYMMYILPYEIEMLEKKLEELTKSEKNHKFQLYNCPFRKKQRYKCRRYR